MHFYFTDHLPIWFLILTHFLTTFANLKIHFGRPDYGYKISCQPYFKLTVLVLKKKLFRFWTEIPVTSIKIYSPWHLLELWVGHFHAHLVLKAYFFELGLFSNQTLLSAHHVTFVPYFPTLSLSLPKHITIYLLNYLIVGNLS